MRWIFGVGGILITLLVIVILLSARGGPGDYMVSTLQKGREAQIDAGQLAGQDANGMRASESIVLDSVTSPGGTRTDALVVTSVVAGGPMQAHFGLMANDQIVEVANQKVRDLNDNELAKALVLEAYQRKQDLIIQRSGVRLAMPGAIPVDGNAAPAASAIPQAAPGTTPPAPVPADPSSVAPAAPVKAPRSSIYDQVNQIPGVQR